MIDDKLDSIVINTPVQKLMAYLHCVHRTLSDKGMIPERVRNLTDHEPTLNVLQSILRVCRIYTPLKMKTSALFFEVPIDVLKSKMNDFFIVDMKTTDLNAIGLSEADIYLLRMKCKTTATIMLHKPSFIPFIYQTPLSKLPEIIQKRIYDKHIQVRDIQLKKEMDKIDRLNYQKALTRRFEFMINKKKLKESDEAEEEKRSKEKQIRDDLHKSYVGPDLVQRPYYQKKKFELTLVDLDRLKDEDKIESVREFEEQKKTLEKEYSIDSARFGAAFQEKLDKIQERSALHSSRYDHIKKEQLKRAKSMRDRYREEQERKMRREHELERRKRIEDEIERRRRIRECDEAYKKKEEEHQKAMRAKQIEFKKYIKIKREKNMEEERKLLDTIMSERRQRTASNMSENDSYIMRYVEVSPSSARKSPTAKTEAGNTKPKKKWPYMGSIVI